MSNVEANLLEAKVRALSAPDAYIERPATVEIVETHFAWVFLGEAYAYKLKKPVRIGGLDLRSLAARAFNCREEVRLNRRLAPTVYLGVVPLVADEHGVLRVEGVGDTVDWLVKMRRLPSASMLDRAIAAGDAPLDRIRALAARLAQFYRSQPPIRFTACGYVERLRQRIAEDERDLLDPALGMPDAAVRRLAAEQAAALDRLHGALGERATQGRIVEAHGDLRPEHVCLSDPPCVIDSLEFSLDLRVLDPLEEMAFFHLECQQLGACAVGDAMVSSYREHAADSYAPAVFDFYRSRRAAIRAKIVAWHLLDPALRGLAPWAVRAERYLHCAHHDALQAQTAIAIP